MAAIRVSVLVERGFVPTELALIQDTLRIAQRLEPNFECFVDVCTTRSEPLIEGAGGALTRATRFETLFANPPHYTIVLGGARISTSFEDIRKRLLRIERMGGTIILLSDAAAEWKRLNDHKENLTSHWENEQLERDAGFSFSTDLPLYTRNSRVITSAGMASTIDVILQHVIGEQSLKLAQSVAQTMLSGEIRDGDTTQPRNSNEVLALEQAKIAPIISAMEDAVEVPLTTTELANIAGFSVRQLERKFRALLKQSPVAYYRLIRLRRAKRLIEQTSLSVAEISLACGFGSQSNFSKKYAQEFGVSPFKHRLQLSNVAPLERTDPNTEKK